MRSRSASRSSPRPITTPPRSSARGNGLLVEPGASGGFAAAISRLLGDEDLRLGMARSAYALGRTMLWRRTVEASMAGFAGLNAPLLLGGGPAREPVQLAEAS